MVKNIEEVTNHWFSELWSKGNLDIAHTFIDPSYKPEWVQIDKSGPEQIIHEVKFFRSIFPYLNYKIMDLTIDGNKSWIKYEASGTQKGNAWGFEPSNKIIKFDGATILTFNDDGKIIDRWGAFCLYDILTELDLVPPFWEIHKMINKN
ncbi:MAG: hypothetical protein HeimC3_05310 [Candidatus Heimdallarchaeota archaeon LC_3]|nr:MAG: hypothetical protein HeimC3_05310 [Candidatus Heimdallarchaeota archaeon LC_3]